MVESILGFGVADSGCNADVCGSEWMTDHMREARCLGRRVIVLGKGGFFGFGGDKQCPIEMTVVGRLRHSPIAFAIDVLPTPGGPVKSSTIPF